MDPAAPMRAPRRGFRRWLRIALICLPALPPAVFLLGNLWLACPPARGWIAGKIQRGCGLEARVGGASFWPWSGVDIRHVEILQPASLRPGVKEPLARIEAIHLAPVWRSWLRGRFELRSLEFGTPELLLPVELLADLARAQAPAVPVSPPALAAAPPTSPAPAAREPSSPAAPPASAPAAPPSSAPLPPTAWLRLNNASLRVISANSGTRRLEVSGIQGAIPLAGRAAASKLRIGSIHIAEHRLPESLELSLDWKAPLLSVMPLETRIRDIKLTFAAKLAMQRGMPMLVEAVVPRQPLAGVPVAADGRAEAESIAATARLGGFLLAPGSWQGNLLAEAVSPSVRLRGNEAKFDRGGAITVLRGGMLSCIDARLIGDDLSLLGNASLLADGRAAAALRMVAAPDSITAMVNRLFPNLPQPPALTPLSTPQRAAYDLRASGNIGHLFMQLGNSGPVMEFKP